MGKMLLSLKKRLYFIVAGYFAFWAKFVLGRWRPRIVIVTGSSGKTTLLHLIEAQLGDKAIYTHHANSAIGIPFHILGLESNISNKTQWLTHALAAPFVAWRKVPKTKLYIVEADCDRPHEGAFLAQLLKPEVTLWVSVYNTHTMNFDNLVSTGIFQNHEAAVAYEFGNYIAATRKLVVVNGDQPAILGQLARVQSGVTIKQASLLNSTYKLETESTIFTVNGQAMSVPGLHPEEVGIAIQLVNELLLYLNEPLDLAYKALEMPLGRSNVLKGKRGITIIDSTYNTGLGAMMAILRLFNQYPKRPKWVVLGDMLELGSLEQAEHEKLAEVIKKLDVQHIILLGRRSKKYIYPLLQHSIKDVPIVVFESPKEVLDYLQDHLHGGETVLFKGARGLEGVIEQLLANPDEAKLLVRREKIWVRRRQEWGLPR